MDRQPNGGGGVGLDPAIAAGREITCSIELVN
jgi:hypothetical protein